MSLKRQWCVIQPLSLNSAALLISVSFCLLSLPPLKTYAGTIRNRAVRVQVWRARAPSLFSFFLFYLTFFLSIFFCVPVCRTVWLFACLPSVFLAVLLFCFLSFFLSFFLCVFSTRSNRSIVQSNDSTPFETRFLSLCLSLYFHLHHFLLLLLLHLPFISFLWFPFPSSYLLWYLNI